MNGENEIWRDIRGFENKYQISSYGRVRRIEGYDQVRRKSGLLFLRPRKGRVLKGCKHTGGYLTVQLGRGGRRYIHRLVAEAFIPNPLGKPSVNHKDGCKENNSVENLEWATYSENQFHAKETGLAPLAEAHPQSKLSNIDVQFIREHYRPFDPVLGAKALGNRFGVAKSIISRIANGTRRVRA
ncbi:NUMOD4 domain-containing protein [Paenibacillus ehimensis]|uniref:NUMOD4 domain-containing protein n=1 Tax=Paenibacillus ehimensis TaxID=79264 RepID=UPI000472AFFF|nr:NUMOD4 domain-containing protein [Paenibacillus ehimensis]